MGFLSTLSTVAKFGTVLVLFLAVALPFTMSMIVRDCQNFSVPSQEGKLFVVTGGNVGLGLASATQIARAGGSVILAVRSLSKGEQGKKELLEEVPGANVDVMRLDLSSFASIKKFAADLVAKYPNGIDALINNAGVMALGERETTTDGLELQVGTNHVGHFLLTRLLLSHLKQNGRIVVHSSTAHLMLSNGDPIRDDFFSEKSYQKWNAYAISKAANLLFTYELNARLAQHGNPKNLSAVAVHPGYTGTKLQRHIPFLEVLNQLVAMSPEEGSQSQTLAACDQNVKSSHNDYLGPSWQIWGPPLLQPTKEYTWDKDLQRHVWELSERVTGEKFL